MNSKMKTNSQLPKKQPKKQKQKQTKQTLEQEENHRNGDHMEVYQWGRWIMRVKVQGIRSINGRYKIDRQRLRIVQEMQKPNNLYI